MAVDAVQLAYERGFVTTFAICTGDSDFTPLVHKLRELDKRVIGIGVQSSTRRCCRRPATSSCSTTGCPGWTRCRRPPRRSGGRTARGPGPCRRRPAPTPRRRGPDRDLGALVARTLAGLQRHTDGPVLASRVKRAILRKDPTFDEADYGFRGFGELLRHLETSGWSSCAPAAPRATRRWCSRTASRRRTTRSGCSWTWWRSCRATAAGPS